MELLINSPQRIYVTKEEFIGFSYYELACFWHNWKVAFYLNDNFDLVMYTGREYVCCTCMKNHRFKGIDWFEIPSAEMYRCTITKDSDLYLFITEKLHYLIMK